MLSKEIKFSKMEFESTVMLPDSGTKYLLYEFL